jgi:hypothetical protein
MYEYFSWGVVDARIATELGFVVDARNAFVKVEVAPNATETCETFLKVDVACETFVKVDVAPNATETCETFVKVDVGQPNWS